MDGPFAFGAFSFGFAVFSDAPSGVRVLGVEPENRNLKVEGEDRNLPVENENRLLAIEGDS